MVTPSYVIGGEDPIHDDNSSSSEDDYDGDAVDDEDSNTDANASDNANVTDDEVHAKNNVHIATKRIKKTGSYLKIPYRCQHCGTIFSKRDQCIRHICSVHYKQTLLERNGQGKQNFEKSHHVYFLLSSSCFSVTLIILQAHIFKVNLVTFCWAPVC